MNVPARGNTNTGLCLSALDNVCLSYSIFQIQMKRERNGCTIYSLYCCRLDMPLTHTRSVTCSARSEYSTSGSNCRQTDSIESVVIGGVAW